MSHNAWAALPGDLPRNYAGGRGLAALPIIIIITTMIIIITITIIISSSSSSSGGASWGSSRRPRSRGEARRPPRGGS